MPFTHDNRPDFNLTIPRSKLRGSSLVTTVSTDQTVPAVETTETAQTVETMVLNLPPTHISFECWVE
jgi:hypothetical protein